jgi:cysteine-rich repeat protein
MVATSVVRQQYLRLFRSAVLLVIGACHVYEPELIRQRSDASVDRGVDASVAPVLSRDAAEGAVEAGALLADVSALDASVGSTRSAATRAQSVPPSVACHSGECWWSADLVGSCRSAGRPGEAHRPALADNPADAITPIYLGWTHLDLGGRAAPDANTAAAWQTFGLDLDGVCTNSASCAGGAQSCRAAASEIPFDGELCRDNRFARLQATLAPVPEIGERYGLREETFNCNLHRGTYNVIVKLSGYNGQLNDPEVRLDFYASPGLTRLPPWNCEDADADDYPIWRASAPWNVDPASLSGEISEEGTLPEATVADPKAFVREGYLVAELPDGAQLRLAGATDSHRSFALTTRKSVWTGALSQLQDGTWQIQDGLVAGTTLSSDLLETFHELGLCQSDSDAEQESDQDSFYELVNNAVRDNADMLGDGRVDESANCDALSFAIAFRAAQLTPGVAAASPERITCCTPSMTPEDCHPACGDGVVSGSEHCDRALLPGDAGACPILCPDIDACTPQRVSGSALSCDALCVPAPITRARAGDGCCPSGANANTDADCASACGNGIVESGEACEPSSEAGCPTSCRHEDACMAGELSGEPEACSVACNWTRIEQCRSGDECCPSGCDQTEDSDCEASCGNRVLEEGERCENGTSTSCPSDCEDDNACTADTFIGSARNCDAHCEHRAITSTTGGDGCCPEGANANNDSDCADTCGNWVREGSEQCDDGNRRSGDGCASDCRNEPAEPESEPETTSDAETQCLALLGNPTDACNGCVCESCEQEVVACRGARSADEAKQCRDVISCATANRCIGPYCYCTAGSQGCTSGTPDGPCREQVEAAAHSDEREEVIARFNDTAYPLGRVMRLTSCWVNSCASTCTPQP